MQKHLILYLQPRSFPKTEHQWLELTLRFFFCPWTFRMYCGCLVLLGHLGGVVWKVRGTGHPAVALSCMFVQLRFSRDSRAAMEILLNSSESTVADGMIKPFNN